LKEENGTILIFLTKMNHRLLWLEHLLEIDTLLVKRARLLFLLDVLIKEVRNYLW